MNRNIYLFASSITLLILGPLTAKGADVSVFGYGFDVLGLCVTMFEGALLKNTNHSKIMKLRCYKRIIDKDKMELYC